MNGWTQPADDDVSTAKRPVLGKWDFGVRKYPGLKASGARRKKKTDSFLFYTASKNGGSLAAERCLSFAESVTSFGQRLNKWLKWIFWFQAAP